MEEQMNIVDYQGAIGNYKGGYIPLEIDRQIVSDIFDLLASLGITANYKGFFYMSTAIQLVIETPERLLSVSKLLYPDVAIRCRTTPACVERNIRTVSQVAWTQNPKLLMELAQRELKEILSSSQFISIVAQKFIMRKPAA